MGKKNKWYYNWSIKSSVDGLTLNGESLGYGEFLGDSSPDSEFFLLKRILIYERFRNYPKYRNEERDPLSVDSKLLAELYEISDSLVPFIKFTSPFSTYSDHSLDVYPGLRVFSLILRRIFLLILKAFIWSMNIFRFGFRLVRAE